MFCVSSQANRNHFLRLTSMKGSAGGRFVSCVTNSELLLSRAKSLVACFDALLQAESRKLKSNKKQGRSSRYPHLENSLRSKTFRSIFNRNASTLDPPCYVRSINIDSASFFAHLRKLSFRMSKRERERKKEKFQDCGNSRKLFQKSIHNQLTVLFQKRLTFHWVFFCVKYKYN